MTLRHLCSSDPRRGRFESSLLRGRLTVGDTINSSRSCHTWCCSGPRNMSVWPAGLHAPARSRGRQVCVHSPGRVDADGAARAACPPQGPRHLATLPAGGPGPCPRGASRPALAVLWPSGRGGLARSRGPDPHSSGAPLRELPDRHARALGAGPTAPFISAEVRPGQGSPLSHEHRVGLKATVPLSHIPGRVTSPPPQGSASREGLRGRCPTPRDCGPQPCLRVTCRPH